MSRGCQGTEHERHTHEAVLGEAHKVVAPSVTEGDDNPLQYPHAFAAASLLVITNVDLLRHVSFDLAAAAAKARQDNPAVEVRCISSWSGEGMDAWMRWLCPPLVAEVAR
jgi:hydrogenase nickel incorporation protein HypB